VAETELSALIVKLDADISGFSSAMLAGQKTMEESTAKMADALAGLDKNTEDHGFNIQHSLETMLGVFSGEALFEAVKHAGEVILDFFKAVAVDSVKAAATEETAMNRLNGALAATGFYSKAASKDMLAYAESLSEGTKYQTSAILTASSLLQTLGQLDTEGLKKATTATANLASRMGIDLESAARLVGKALEGNTTALKRMGIEVEAGSTHAETFSNVMRALNTRIGDAAAQELNTYAGAIAHLGNQWEETKVALGGALTSNVAVINVMKEASHIIGELTDWIKANQKTVAEWIAGSLVKAADALQYVVKFTDSFYRVGVIAFEAVKMAGLGMAGAITMALQLTVGAIDGLLAKIPGIGTQFGHVKEQLDKTFSGLEKQADASAKSMVEALKHPTEAGLLLYEQTEKIKGAAKEGFDAVIGGAKASANVVNGVKDAMRDLSAEMKALGDAGKTLAEDLTSVDPSKQYAKQKEAFSIYKADHNRDLGDLHKKELDAQKKYQSDEEKALRAGLNQHKIGHEEYYKSVGKLREKNDLEQTQLRQEQEKEDQADLQAKLGFTSQFFGNMSSLMNTKSAELFEIGKAAATAQAIVDGYAAVAKTMASVPYPFNIPLAIAQGIASAVQVANIQSQHLATGIDEVPGAGSADTFPAMLAPGERVVPANTNQDLKAYLSQQNNETPSLLRSILGRLEQLENHVIVNVGGREIVNVINDQIRGGRALVVP